MPKTPRDIVQSAYEYLMSITPPTQKVTDVRVETLEPIKEQAVDFWKVILSYDSGQYVFEKKRDYKEFKVGLEGEVISMKSVDGK